MESLVLAMIVVTVIGIMCIYITLKSSFEPAVSWECDTCGIHNASGLVQCSQCGMERQA